MYIELHAASAFSFLQGASLPEILIDRAVETGHTTLALLDRDGVYGAPRFHKAAIAAGIRPIFGAELSITASKSEVRNQKSASLAQRGVSSHPTGETRQTSDFKLQTFSFALPVLCETSRATATFASSSRG